MFPISSFSNCCSQVCSLIKISVAPCDASTPRSTRSIILSKFGHTSDTIRSILRPSLAGSGKTRGGEEERRKKTLEEILSWRFRRENCQQSSDCITVPRGEVHRPLENLQAFGNRSSSSVFHPLHTKCFLPVLRFHFIFRLFV